MNSNRRLFGKPKRPLFVRVTFWFFSGLTTILLLVLGLIYFILNDSLATYDGQLSLDGLNQSVSIERDQLGVPTIIAADRDDLAFALGFTHAQERFFQMDLQRRQAAGELSELMGNSTVNYDKRFRVHRFRSRVKQQITQLDPESLSMLKAYTEGVNSGLEQLDSKPFEYYLINAEPKSWLPEDTLLVVYAMYFSLQPGNLEREKTLQLAYQNLPRELYDFLVPPGTSFDAPLDNSVFELPKVPSNTAPSFKLAEQSDTPAAELIPGSNNFALAGSKTLSGHAMVAGDMHLGLNVPTIWYKARMQYQVDGETVDLIGVTLPGTPLLVSGTNGKVAWAFTNSYGDYYDAIPLSIDANNPGHYLYQEQNLPLREYVEEIKVKGQAAESFSVKETIFGPVLESDENTVWSHFWVAHQPESVNLTHQQLERAEDVYQAVDIANRSAIPAQNFVVGDSTGNIAWTIIGPMPQRQTSDNPVTTIAHQQGKISWLPADQYPRIINPDANSIWTANARVVGGEMLTKVGDGGYALAARSVQIRDKLAPLEKAEETDLLAIQLDTDATLHWYWRDLVVNLLSAENLAANPNRQSFKRLIEQWNGRADVEQVGFTLIRQYRLELRRLLLEPWVKHLNTDATNGFHRYSSSYEHPLRQIVTEQPAAFLPEGYTSFEALLLNAVDKSIDKLTQGDRKLEDNQWGSRNQLAVRHQISRAVPLLGYWLDMESHPMPGSSHTPRAQGRSFGASQRMVISPGQLESSIFHLPGGQSGNPLSPFYREGFDAWVSGQPLPLLPGSRQHALQLRPANSD